MLPTKSNMTCFHPLKFLNRDDLGLSKLTLLIFGFITTVIVYSSYHIIPFFYYYYELQNQMDAVISVASTHTDQEVRKKLLYHVKKMQIPITPEEIMIVRNGDIMELSVEYDEIFYITVNEKDYDLHTFHFHAYSEGNIR